jgi:hypothetical protein
MIASFWKPVLDAASTPIIAMASLDGAVEWHKLASETSKVRRTTTQNLVVPEDVTALSLVIELFHAQKQRFKLATANATSLSDLRSGPNVLIGNYNNRWTIRFLSETPFVPRLPDEGFIFGIRDTRVENPHTWSVNLGGEVAGIDTDYGLITRFINPATNQPTVALGGIGPYATIGAAEFLTNPIFFHQFCRQAPQKWTEHNLQIVIRLDVVDGCPGPPQILASAFW